MTSKRKKHQAPTWTEASRQDFVLDFNFPETFLQWWDRLFPVESPENRPIRRLGAGL
mgnify:CR=1 FL=1